MKMIVTCMLIGISFGCFSQSKITPQELKLIIGEWTGSLTYLNYQTNEPFTMPADLLVEEGKTDNMVVLNFIYPNEPAANSTGRLTITKNGELLNKEKVVSRKELDNGQIEIKTESKGRDDNKKAFIRITYIFGQDAFLTRKEVQFEESDEWIKRNEFTYQRKN